MMAGMLAATRDPKRMRYAEIIRQFIAETVIRIRRRLTRRKSWAIDDVRRFKGL
jgi:hypothetical protein